MKLKTGLAILFLLFAVEAQAQTGFGGYSIMNVARERWGWFDGLQRAETWVGDDGTWNLQSTQPGTGSRIIIWPSSGIGPDIGAASELTIYRRTDQSLGHAEANFERMSFTAMNRNEPGFRISIEEGGDGAFVPLRICYDTYFPSPGPGFPARAWCALTFNPDTGDIVVCRPNGSCRVINEEGDL